ncbi:MAG: MerR family transcriptional regulator [Lachnospiraceae bacterium]|nr:MerR family transcriptional regulator [Lachnospiraceae bacterium]
MDKEIFYTTGELAEIAGITYKSIRIYVEKGLLTPDKITESGYKLFSRRSVEKLQRILMFKYLDFTLEEIGQMLEYENIQESLGKQLELIELKITHLNQIKKAVEDMQSLSDEKNWDKMLDIMKLTSQREEVIKQYIKSDNLEKRINIHEYSTSDVNWHDYLLDKCDIKEGMSILDIGCGNGLLWYRERNLLPDNINIYLVDNSKAMLDSAKQIHFSEKDFYTDKNIKFHYHICDASNINKLLEINSKKFHRIMANHMLYHIDDSDRKLLLGYVNAMLTDDGKFIASTIGKNHMKEIFELAYEYDKNVKAPEWFSRGFILENGKEQLDVFFSNVTMFYHDNNLLIPDWRVIYDYLCSLPGIEKVMRKNKEASVKFLKDRVTESKPFFIRKSTGVFVAKKNFEG